MSRTNSAIVSGRAGGGTCNRCRHQLFQILRSETRAPRVLDAYPSWASSASCQCLLPRHQSKDTAHFVHKWWDNFARTMLGPCVASSAVTIWYAAISGVVVTKGDVANSLSVPTATTIALIGFTFEWRVAPTRGQSFVTIRSASEIHSQS